MKLGQAAKLLIVEDEPITRSKLAAHFEKEGYEVVCREDGNDTLDLVSEENIELCLIDINLPGKDGLTLTRELPRHFRRWNYPGDGEKTNKSTASSALSPAQTITSTQNLSILENSCLA